MEIWKNIEGYKGRYKVSNYGRVLSEKRVYLLKDGRSYTKSKKLMSPNPANNGYLKVQLSLKSKAKTVSVHRLVALHFKQNPRHLPQVNHIDGDKTNNHVDNLEWCSRVENIAHAVRNRLIVSKGTNNPNCKLTLIQVAQIQSLVSAGATNKFIFESELYPVTKENINSIRHKKSWSHIDLGLKE